MSQSKKNDDRKGRMIRFEDGGTTVIKAVTTKVIRDSEKDLDHCLFLLLLRLKEGQQQNLNKRE